MSVQDKLGNCIVQSKMRHKVEVNENYVKLWKEN